MAPTNELLALVAERPKGNQRRQFQAEVCTKLGSGSPRKAEQYFGWEGKPSAKGLREQSGEIEVVEHTLRRGRQRSQDANPQLAIVAKEVERRAAHLLGRGASLRVTHVLERPTPSRCST